MDLLEEKWVSKAFSRMISEVANTVDRGADVFLQGKLLKNVLCLCAELLSYFRVIQVKISNGFNHCKYKI